jgi:hypothetical protein
LSKNVFANGREISGKKDDNKSVASMPDVCLSPPSPPAGPVPIPYPNTAQASDTSDGSKTVKIGGGEVGLKDASNYKKSTGDEAATKSLGMGVVSHNIQGMLKHAAWSMDVKIEGQNAIRHMDMVTQNHMNPSNACPGIDLGSPDTALIGDPECVELEKQARKAVEEDTPNGKLPNNDAVVTAIAVPGGSFKAVQPGKDWVRSGASNGYSQPSGKANHPCGGKPHNTNPQGNKDHAENKVMHHALPGGAPGGGSITMRVNWNNNGSLSNSPCTQCMGSICETAEACGIEINICTNAEDGSLKKEPAPCKTVNHKDGTTSKKWTSSLLEGSLLPV